MLLATKTNIDWLLEKLKVAACEISCSNISNPCFVLLTSGREDRRRVEQIFYKYFHDKYGDLGLKQIDPRADTESLSSYWFSEIGVQVMLMDV